MTELFNALLSAIIHSDSDDSKENSELEYTEENTRRIKMATRRAAILFQFFLAESTISYKLDLAYITKGLLFCVALIWKTGMLRFATFDSSQSSLKPKFEFVIFKVNCLLK